MRLKRTEKNPEILLEMENYGICRRVYQLLFVEIGNTFIQYINTLRLDEIEQLDYSLKAKSWGVRSVVEIENSIDLVCIFQMFYYYYNGRLPLAKGLFPVPNGEMLSDSEKISLKILHKIFKDTKSHGLISLPFLLALNIFLVMTLVC